MFDVMADWLTVPLLNAEDGKSPKRIGLAHPSIAPYGVFRSKDGKEILISIQSEREWKTLCAKVLDQPGLPDDPRFANMVERVRNRALTDEIVGDAFGKRDARRAAEEARRRPTSPSPRSTRMDDLAKHPHLRRIEVDTPNGKRQLSGAGARSSSARTRALRQGAGDRRAHQNA